MFSHTEQVSCVRTSTENGLAMAGPAGPVPVPMPRLANLTTLRWYFD